MSERRTHLPVFRLHPRGARQTRRTTALSVSSRLALPGSEHDARLDAHALSALGLSVAALPAIRLAAIVSSSAVSAQLPLYTLPSPLLWKNAVATGLAMEVLAKAAETDDRIAYTPGLLRSGGWLLLQQMADGHSPPPSFSPDLQGIDLLAWEHQSFGHTRFEAMATTLPHWGLNPLLAESIRHHLEPGRTSTPNVGAHAARLHLACLLVHEAGLGLPLEVATGWSAGEELVRQAGLTPGTFASVLDGFRGAAASLQSG